MVVGPLSEDHAGREDRIERAVRRLHRAASVLEQRLERRIAEAQAHAGGLADADRARLAAELDAARARERELEAAGAEASRALANAIDQLRAAAGDLDEDPAPWAG
jgi:F0F1-type ATP synthase membrane subunit b/b'